MNSINVRKVNSYWFFLVMIKIFKVTNLLLNSIKLISKTEKDYEHN